MDAPYPLRFLGSTLSKNQVSILPGHMTQGEFTDLNAQRFSIILGSGVAANWVLFWRSGHAFDSRSDTSLAGSHHD